MHGVDKQVQKAALIILWMALQGEEMSYMCSTTFAEATGLDGKQKCGLVLSSSVQVTRMTYQTDEDLLGGFLPVFWDVPRANLHAVVDIGAVVDWLQFSIPMHDAKSSLAVLHNQNDMVTHFKASSWCEAQGAVVTRGLQLVQESLPIQ